MSKIERVVIIMLTVFIIVAIGSSLWAISGEIWRALAPEREAVVLPATVSEAYLTCYYGGPADAPWEWEIPFDEYRQRPMQDIHVSSAVMLDNGMLQAIDYEDGGVYLCDRYILRGVGTYGEIPEAVMPEGEQA